MFKQNKFIQFQLITVLFFFSIVCYGQNPILHALKPGDKMPDIDLNVYTGGKISKTNSSTFRNKLLIIDFWGVGCGSCIQSLPKMLKLQQKFPDEIQVLIVTRDSKMQYERLLKNLELHSTQEIVTAAKTLPFVFSDSILKKMFPYLGVPAHVWILKGGILKGIVDAESTTPENILKELKGEKVTLSPYFGMTTTSNENLKNWLLNRIPSSTQFLNYSFLMKNDSTANDNHRPDPVKDSVTGEIIGVTAVNKSIFELYQYAYSNNGEDYNNYTFANTRNQSKFSSIRASEFQSWHRTNSYCFAFKVQLNEAKNLNSIMIKELDRAFRISSKIEIRNVKCLVLKALSNSIELHSKGGELYNQHVLKSGRTFQKIVNGTGMELLQDILVDYISRWTNPGLPFPPLTDETATLGKIDLEIPWGEDDYSLSTLQNILKAKGLELTWEERKLKILVLYDLDSQNN